MHSLRVRAWGHELWTVPPPSQGYLTLAGAWVAEAAGLGTEPDEARWAHLLVECWRAVGYDRPDVLFDGADGDALLHPGRLERRPNESTTAGRRHPTWLRATGPWWRRWRASVTATPHTSAPWTATASGSR